MNNSLIPDFYKMTIEQLEKWISSQNLTSQELETFKKGTEMIDSASNLNDANKVWIALIAYSIYKVKGGK